jgi:hypothetical protein
MKTVLSVGVLLWMAAALPAHAYLDPGTGSMILQAVIATVAMSVAAISVYWQKFKSFFAGEKKAEQAQKPEE